MADEKEKFVRKEYNEANDTATKSAWDRMNTLSTAKPTYTDNWSNSLNTLANDILNGKKFTYDLNGDALYQQYKDKYINQGRLAMADTIGQASAMTGGYGNSYAVTAGNQAYQSSLQNLNDVVPELYQLALDKYNTDRQDLYNQYGVISDRENTEYGRHRDSVTDWQNEYGMAVDEYWNNKNFGYGKHTDDENFRYSEYINEQAASNTGSTGGSGGGGGGYSPYGEFSAKDFAEMMYDAYLNGDTKHANALVQMTGGTSEAWAVYDKYFGEDLEIEDEDDKVGKGSGGGGGGGGTFRYTTAHLN